MYKVVIIDDEPVIVKGLTKVIKWEKFDCEVVGSAEDGLEGLELIREKKPDIVFSDIYMPKMDGLKMIVALKSEFEDMEITILTGYRDFELVRQALNYGVTRFILKPSNMEELEEAVQVMTERLRKKGIPADGMCTEEDRPNQLLSEVEPSDTEEQSTDISSATGSFIVNNAMNYIRENYNRKITLKEVADQTYVSQWHLSKLLNRHTGKGFLEIMNTVRIEEAQKLLCDSSLRVGDVAEIVGFLDMAHFSRVFKKITGMSANEYRNKLQ